MATLGENIITIRTAIYGKEMRPAIYNALLQSWQEVLAMEESVEELNKRVNELPGGVGGGGSEEDPGGSGGGVIVNDGLTPPILVVYGASTGLRIAGTASIVSA